MRYAEGSKLPPTRNSRAGAGIPQPKPAQLGKHSTGEYSCHLLFVAYGLSCRGRCSLRIKAVQFGGFYIWKV